MSDIVPQNPLDKQCPKCKDFFPPTTEYFPPRYDGKGGLRRTCRNCINARQRKYLQEHKEQCKTYKQKYLDAHKEEQREKNRLRTARYRAENPEKYRQIDENRREYLREHHRQHNKNNREVYRTRDRNRRARTKQATGTHTRQDIQSQYERQKGKCYYCHCKIQWGKHHVDHVIPISRGGSNDPSNLVIACPTCNLRKQGKLPHEWAEGGRLF